MTCANALVVHTMTTRERAVVSYSETLLARYRHLGNNAPSRLVLRFDDVCERYIPITLTPEDTYDPH